MAVKSVLYTKVSVKDENAGNWLQLWWVGEVREMQFNGYKVSVRQDEKLLEI